MGEAATRGAELAKEHYERMLAYMAFLFGELGHEAGLLLDVGEFLRCHALLAGKGYPDLSGDPPRP